jgi:hypothetical protein
LGDRQAFPQRPPIEAIVSVEILTPIRAPVTDRIACAAKIVKTAGFVGGSLQM